MAEKHRQSTEPIDGYHTADGLQSGPLDPLDIEGGHKQQTSKGKLHEWEHAVWQRHAHPQIREQVKYEGFFWRKGRPLLVTAASGVDEHGRPFHWHARRHRMGRTMLHEIEGGASDGHHEPAKTQGVRKQEWRWWYPLAFWRYKTADQALTWWSGLAFLIGGILFAISGLAGSIREVYDTSLDGRWSLYAWLDGYTSIAGTDIFFLPGVLMVLIQTGNTNLGARVKMWENNGCKGRKPHYRWFLPFNPHSLMSWAAWVMLGAKLCFSTAFTAFGLNAGGVTMSQPVITYLIWVPGFIGSVGFMFFGLCQSWEASHSLYKAIVPLFPSTIKSLGCWSASSGFWGGALFTVGSAGFLATTGMGRNPSYAGNVLLNILGYFIGSLFFMLNGFLSMVEVSLPDSKA